MDVLEIDGASNRGIEEIRNLREVIKYAPMNAPYKVFIIDEVHMLTTQAFNALLRTLEEPPPHGKFIMATTDVHKVPATIISRCQRFDFNRITDKIISDRLSTILKEEGISIDDESLEAVAQKADGSMRDGLSLLDQIIAFSEDSITIDAISEIIGLIPSELYFTITEALIQKDTISAIEQAKAIKKTGMPVSEVAIGLNQHLRNLMYSKVDGGEELLTCGDDLKDRYISHGKDWTKEDLLRLSDQVSRLEVESKRASHPYIMLELVLLKLLEYESVTSLESILSGKTPLAKPVKPQRKAERQVKKATVNKPPVIPSTEKKPPVKNEKPSEVVKTQVEKDDTDAKSVLVDIGKKWPEIVEKISLKKASISALIEHCFFQGTEGSIVHISVQDIPKFNVKIIEQNRDVIESVIKEISGQSLGARFHWVEPGESKAGDGEPKPLKNELAQKENPQGDAVSKIIELFDGEIIR